jgi:hypothetical protein
VVAAAVAAPARRRTASSAAAERRRRLVVDVMLGCSPAGFLGGARSMARRVGSRGTVYIYSEQEKSERKLRSK